MLIFIHYYYIDCLHLGLSIFFLICLKLYVSIIVHFYFGSKSKRRSVPEAAVAVPKDNIFKSFVSRNSSAPAPAAVPAPVPTHAPAPVPAPAPSAVPAAAAAPSVRARTAPPRGSTDPETNRNNTVTSNDVQNFLKKRIPQYIDLQAIDDGTDGTGSLALDDDELDSGRHTSSSELL